MVMKYSKNKMVVMSMVFYWTECKNGYSSRSWDLNCKINKADDFYMELFINGIYLK